MEDRTAQIAATLLGFLIAAMVSATEPASAGAAKTCSATTAAAFRACKLAVQSDLALAQGNCRNEPDPASQRSCLSDAKGTRDDDAQSCQDQRAARADVCKALGEGPYQPNFNPADFDTDFTTLTHPNPLFPLAIGDQWTYATGAEMDQMEITSATKLIDGVTCIAAHDAVELGGQLSEDTQDWLAQAKNGDVYYCGEQTAQYETFPGDNPQEPELVGIEGSFKAGRGSDLPGILMLASPTVGAVYRQEFSLGTAEDLAEVLSTSYAFGQNAELDQHVPQALAELLCAGDCLVTREFSPLEPDAVERKYYAPGIGDFLEVALDTGDVTQLVDCNMDPRCSILPTP